MALRVVLVDQQEAAKRLIEQFDDDSHEHDIGVLDLLDSMGSVGLSFIERDDASLAYFEALKERTQ
jgi:hypothetical protein